MNKAFFFRVLLFLCFFSFMVFLGQHSARSQAPESSLTMRVSSLDEFSAETHVYTAPTEQFIGNSDAMYWQRRDFSNYSEYVEEMQKVLKSVWAPPKRGNSYQVTLKFKVFKDGKVTALRVIKSSGDLDSDRAAVAAVRASLPFAPLPSREKAESVDVDFSFDYNVKTQAKQEMETLAEGPRAYKVYISSNSEAIPAYKQADFRSFTREAMDEWTRVSRGQVKFTTTSDPKEANLWVTWTPDFANPGALGYTRCNKEHSKCWVQIRSMYRPGGDTVMKDSFTRLTLLHEVGHVIGLGHSRRAADIMCTGEHGDTCSQMVNAVKSSDFIPEITEGDREDLATVFTATRQANSNVGNTNPQASYNTLGTINR